MQTLEENIENVQKIRSEVLESLEVLPSLSLSREEALNLQFKPGDIVYDKRTGKQLEVIAGTRRTVAVSTSRG